MVESTHVSTATTRTRTIWRDVLKICCSDDVIDAYALLKSKEAQNKMLDAFKANVMHLLLDQNRMHHMDQLRGYSSRKNPSTPISASTDEELLQEAVRREGSSLTFYNFNAIKRILAEWGRTKSKRDLIEEHEEKSCSFRKQFVDNLKTRDMSLLEHFKTLSTDTTVTKHSSHQTGAPVFKKATDPHTTNLKPIGVKDLKLFETCRGSSLEGTLVGYARLFVGVTTLLQDSDGDVIQIAIYNTILDGPDKFSITERLFPRGRRIKIIEPFMKIFRDGIRGVRVDQPSDICFIDYDNNDERTNIDDIRIMGKKLMDTGQYLAAFDLYYDWVLSNSELLVPLLNNRSQTELHLGQYEEAMLDAAAVLFLKMGDEKAQHRYETAFKNINNRSKDNNEVWGRLLKQICIIYENQGGRRENEKYEKAKLGNNVTHQKLGKNKIENRRRVGTKKSGNEFFASCQYSLAKDEYTSAINFTDVSVLLTNIALASFQLNMHQTVIAACSNCLRITNNDQQKQKALYLMAKSFIILRKCHLYQEYIAPILNYRKNLDKMCSSIENCEELIQQTLTRSENKVFLDDGRTLSISSIRDFVSQTSSHKVSDFTKQEKMEHVYIRGKGRGILALRDIKEGEVLLIDHPVVGKGTDPCETKTFRRAFNFNRNVAISDGELKLTTALLSLVKHDGLLMKKLLCLEHNPNVSSHTSSLPLVDLEQFSYRHLDETVPPFLCQTNEVLGNDTNAINQVVIENIVSVNTFAHGSIDSIDDFCNGSALCMRISLFNHDDEFNCRVLPFADSLVLFAIKDIPEGIELTIFYNDNCEWSRNAQT